MAEFVTVADVFEEMKLELVNQGTGLERKVETIEVNRPGFALSGFLMYYPSERIQILGRTEMAYLHSLPEEDIKERVMRMCSFENTPCFIFTRGLDIPAIFMEASEKSGIPLLRTHHSTPRLLSQITSFLEIRLAPETLVHGVLVDVYGIGILMTGSSGIGKSETALELLKRGHRLVADDAVEIRQISDDTLVGTVPPLLQYLLEIRGLGVINAMTLFGAGAVRTHKRIEMIVELEAWEEGRPYDRLGLDDVKKKILGVELTSVTVPVRPGRNLAVIIEVAAMNQRLKRMGYHAAKELSEKLLSSIQDQG